MENKEIVGNGIEIKLTSLKQVPYSFSINIKELGERKDAGFLFRVSGPDIQTGSEKTCHYQSNDREHNAYLNFYQELAEDFGLRIPQNCRQRTTKPTAKVAYQEILCENLTPEILYGYGDPAVLRIEGTSDEETRYYLVATSNDAPNSFPILRSRNLKDWEFVSFVFPQGQKPIWAADGELVSDYWAPEMHNIANEFRLYFVARDKHTRELCIGMARSSVPEGPFIPDDEPILKGNITDPHVFVQDDETAFLYWKEDNNDVWPGKLVDLLETNPDLIPALFEKQEDRITVSFILTLWPWARILEPMERFLVTQVLIEAVIEKYLDFYNQLTSLLENQPAGMQEQIRDVQKYMKTPMFAQQLSADGSALIGERIKILENDLDWEAHLVEGMWVTKQDSCYYLFYAGNDFSTDQYGIGVAIANSPLGPFHKIPRQFLQSTAEWWAPGHPSVAIGPDGKLTLFLHAYYPGKAGYKQFRALLAVPLKLEKDRVLLD